MNHSSRIVSMIAKSPILWGCLASAGFYGLYHFGILNHPLVAEYFAGHPIEYATTVMFFVGLAVLLVKLAELAAAAPYRDGDPHLLGSITPGGQSVSICPLLLERLDQLPGSRTGDPIDVRLRETLQWVLRQGSAEGIDGQLKYLAEREAERLYESYSLFRLVTWAIPILGFLGTVIGITMAIANLGTGAIEQMMKPTIAALMVAFNTTAQALGLVLILMLLKYLVSLAETRLYDRVDQLAEEELLGRFEVVLAGPDGQVAAVRQLGEVVLRATEELVRRQVELWQESLRGGQQRFAQSLEAAGEQLEQALAAALDRNLKAHAAALTQSEQSLARRNEEHWGRVQQALVESAEAALALQKAVNQQTGILQQTVEATGQVARLEEALNRNLATLAGAKHFEQTVMSLAAAIPLLTTRLSETPEPGGRIRLGGIREKPHAA